MQSSSRLYTAKSFSIVLAQECKKKGSTFLNALERYFLEGGGIFFIFILLLYPSILVISVLKVLLVIYDQNS